MKIAYITIKTKGGMYTEGCIMLDGGKYATIGRSIDGMLDEHRDDTPITDGLEVTVKVKYQ